ncbi:MAG: choice-of-anchor B family protein, partial [Ignavibacteria bacterium]|nr:choice-of-anchor B family protein [Ignavibacteria bacterium]
NLDQYATYSNIWGYERDGREYALIGHDAGTSIVDITDPESPVEIEMIPGPTAFGTIWREIKVLNDYAYVVSEHTAPNGLSGVQIIDLSQLPVTATLVNNYRWPGVDSTNARAHTVSVDDEGYLYIQGGTATFGEGGVQGGIRILDLSDPENPTPLSVHPPVYVHDVFVRDTLLFASNIFEGGHMEILSVADRANPVLITTLTYPNGFSHNSWATEDGNFLLTTDEIVGLTMKVWDISVLWDADPGNNDQIEMVGEYIGDPGSIPHNVYVRGNHAYVSHYLEGVKVLDISDPSDPVEVGYYDTHLSGGGSFDGDWGVYPYLPSGNIIVSDIQTGLYVFRFDTAGAGGVQGTVTSAADGRPVAGATIGFVEANKSVTTDALGFYSLRTSEGNHTLAVSANAFLDDTVNVSIPAGANITFDMTLDSNLVRVAFSPGSFDVALAPDSMATAELIVQNIGIGTLIYGLNDVQGGARRRPVMESPPTLDFPRFQTLPLSADPPTLAGDPDTVLVDPLDDLLFGEEPDIFIVTASVSETDVTFTFEFEDPVNTDSVAGVWALDIDFDITTGAHPGGFGTLEPEQDLGAEYDILIDCPGVLGTPQTANLWVGSNDIPSVDPLFSTPLTISGNLISFTIPLSELNGDDGNMAVAGVFVHVDAFGQATSVDLAPDIGNATV